MANVVKWLVDERDTYVEIVDDGCEIVVVQCDNPISLTPTGTSASELIDALIAAVIEAGWDLPDLSRHGYALTGGDK